MTNWNPQTEPYRVLITQKSNAYGMYGWKSRVAGVFATLELAEAEFNKPQGRGIIEVAIDVAENAATWSKNGRWKKLRSRKRLKGS